MLQDVIFNNLDETILVETKNMKMVTYLTDFFLAYNQNLMLVGDHQQGKSSVIQSSLRKLIETNKIVSFNFGMQRSMNLEIV